MRSDPTIAALHDIVNNIDLALGFTAGFDYEGFVISEASRRLPAGLKARDATIEWKYMAGAGNIYRHDYEDVVAQQVWDALQIDLPPLRVVVETELAALDPPAG